MTHNYDRVPAEMKAARRWVCRIGKIPINPNTLRGANSTDAATWGSYDEAYAAIGKAASCGNLTGDVDGIGFVLGDGWAGIDLDTVRDPETGIAAPEALEILKSINTYTEVSPSRYGYHLFIHTDKGVQLAGNKFPLPPNEVKRPPENGKAKAPELEIYTEGRYFTVTGQECGKKHAVTLRTDEVKELAERYATQRKAAHVAQAPLSVLSPLTLADDELIRAIRRGNKAGAFERLYDRGDLTGNGNDHSAADIELCGILAFYTGRNAEQMDRLFRSSALIRSKWDERHGAETYGAMTINTAIANCGAVYNPAEYYRVSARDDFSKPLDSDFIVSYRPTDFSDAGNMDVFVSLHGNDFCYTDSVGWLCWDGKRWEANDHRIVSRVTRFTQEMLDDARRELSEADAALQAAQNEASPEPVDIMDMPENDAISVAQGRQKAAKAYYAHAMKSRSANKIQAVVTLCRAHLHRSITEFDADPYIINTPAGIIDLRTGALQPHNREKKCTRITRGIPAASYADDGQLFENFLHTITCGDRALQAYLQELAGMALVGEVLDEALIIACGSGANGKSTFFNTLYEVMGDYAGTFDVDAITTRKNDNRAELATLRGRRLVIAGELEEFQRLSSSTVKRICSTDYIHICEKFKQPEEIKPAHTMCLFTNHLPRVGSLDNGIWRRLRIIPFNAHIEGDADIKNYARYLVDSCGGAVLRWMIDGAALFIEHGGKIASPATVTEATAEYRQEENWLENFISECCVTGDPEFRVPAWQLLDAYRIWATANGEYAKIRGNEFYHAMSKAGYLSVRPQNKRIWVGIALNREYDLRVPKGYTDFTA